jgi:hypothetical protein
MFQWCRRTALATANGRAGCGEPPRAIAHIRVLFSDLVKGG